MQVLLLISDLMGSYKMEITYYQNTAGEEMILIVDAENDKAESMTKSEYERRQANEASIK
jgi:hypothetical protein